MKSINFCACHTAFNICTRKLKVHFFKTATYFSSLRFNSDLGGGAGHVETSMFWSSVYVEIIVVFNISVGSRRLISTHFSSSLTVILCQGLPPTPGL